MSKYIRVTHTYLVPMPDDLPDDDPTMETTINRGVSMMEDHMLKLYEDPRRCVDLRTTWLLIEKDESEKIERRQPSRPDVWENVPPPITPRRAPTRGPLPPNPDERDRLDALAAIEGDFDRGVSFAKDVMGQDPKAPHPWDVGLWIFPVGHPLRAVEERAKAGDEEALEAFEEARKELPE